MDILAQYEKENPELKQSSQKIYDDQSEDYGPIIRFVMKIFNGKIQNVQQVNTVLAGAAIIMTIIALVLLFGLPGSSTHTVPLLRSAHPDILIK